MASKRLHGDASLAAENRRLAASHEMLLRRVLDLLGVMVVVEMEIRRPGADLTSLATLMHACICKGPYP